MDNVNKRENKPENTLIIAMVVCILYGLYIIRYALSFRGRLEPPSRVNWNDVDSINSWVQNQYLHTLINLLIPISGLVFILVGLLIWCYCRKMRVAIESDQSSGETRKSRWHLMPMAALTVALVCMLIAWLADRQGYLTIRVYGLDFGFAHVKSLFFFVWFSELHRFPLDAILFYAVWVATGVAMFFTFRHFGLRRSDA
jgi:hypothetical protein